MTLETIAEHTIATNLLPEKANILDLGCRGFLFSNELRRRGHNIVSVDCDWLDSGYPYHQIAISDSIGEVWLYKNSDPQATGIKNEKGKHIDSRETVPCTTLQEFSKSVGIEFWDAIKIDVEGSEFEIIMSLQVPPATQISVEFHHHCGQSIMDISNMVEHLRKLGYNPVKHELSKQHGGIWNFWSSLFILRDKL